MSDQTGDHISPELAEAFSWAVYHYRHVWTPGTPEITRKLSNGSFTMIGVCDLVDKFTDPLPDGLFDILRSETHQAPMYRRWMQIGPIEGAPGIFAY